jgi:hypothetical protein
MGRGGGCLFPILSKTDVSFDGRNSGTNQIVPVAVGIDSSSWVSGVLAVRLHAKNTWATSPARLHVKVQNIMLVPEEPDVVYLASGDVSSVAFVQGTDSAPLLKVAAFAAPIGPMLRVILEWEQGATAASAAQTASISVDLVGRPA